MWHAATAPVLQHVKVDMCQLLVPEQINYTEHYFFKRIATYLAACGAPYSAQMAMPPILDAYQLLVA